MDHLTEWLSIGMSFVVGFCIALWRAFTIVNRVSLAEQRINQIQVDVNELKQEHRMLEDRLITKLDQIDTKLDDFILKFIKND